MPTPPLPYVTVDGTPHALDLIEPVDANRLRLVFGGPAPALRDRVPYVLVEAASAPGRQSTRL